MNEMTTAFSKEMVTTGNCIPAMSDEDVLQVRQLEEEVLKLPQTEITTIHSLHGGVYTRTIFVPAGVVMTGVLITIPTTLIVSGNATVYVGGVAINIEGYKVFPASANRRQALVTNSNTWFTLIFPTDAQTVVEAEEQFTNEAHLLGSRKESSPNIVLRGE
jgi:hypothetical protein